MVVTFLHLDVALAGVGWLALGIAHLPALPPPPGTRPHHDHEGRDPQARSSTTRPSTSRSSSRSTAASTPPAPWPRRSSSPPAGAAGSTCSSRSPCRSRRRSGAELPEQELAAQAIIEQAKLQGGRRVSGHWRRSAPGQAGRLIVREAREMRAQAILLPLPRRGAASLFGKTVETVLSERPARVVLLSDPGDRSAGAAGDGAVARAARAERRADAGAPEPPQRRVAGAVGRHGPPRGGDPRLDDRARRRPARARRPPRGPLRRAPGSAASTSNVRAGGRRTGAAAQPGLVDALRDRLRGGRELDLLLARGHRRPRARAHAVRLPARGGLLPPGGDDVRRGRVAAPGPRRLDGLRALRLQRGRELHRRLGGAPGLHHPRRGQRLLGDELPRRLLGAARRRHARAAAGLRDRRLRRHRDDPRVLAASRHARGHGRGRRPRRAAARRHRRPGDVLPPRPDPRSDPAGAPAAVARRLLRAGHRHRRLPRAGVGLRAGG